jgi:uncharacterized membrane protein
MKSFAPSLAVILAGFGLLVAAAMVMATSPARDDEESHDLGDIDRWLVEPYGRALSSFAACLVVMLIGLALIAEAAAAVFSHP